MLGIPGGVLSVDCYGVGSTGRVCTGFCRRRPIEVLLVEPTWKRKGRRVPLCCSCVNLGVVVMVVTSKVFGGAASRGREGPA